jgi:hypothetical protein
MPTPYTEELPVELTVYRSPLDGVVVVQIDQEQNNEDDTRIRVYLNDSPIFQGDTETTNVLDQDVARDVAMHLEKAWDVASVPQWEQENLRIAVYKAISFLRGESRS